MSYHRCKGLWGHTKARHRTFIVGAPRMVLQQSSVRMHYRADRKVVALELGLKRPRFDTSVPCLSCGVEPLGISRIRGPKRKPGRCGEGARLLSAFPCCGPGFLEAPSSAYSLQQCRVLLSSARGRASLFELFRGVALRPEAGNLEWSADVYTGSMLPIVVLVYITYMFHTWVPGPLA